jgi:PAS domain S-box-containing protein
VLKEFRAQDPGPAFRYFAPLAGLTAVTAAFWAVATYLGPGHVIVSGILWLAFVLTLLSAAWLDYGPGLLVSALIPLIMLAIHPGRPTPLRSTILLQFCVLSVIALLVSRIASSNRRQEADLRKAARELEERVRLRTAEAVASAAASGEQAQLLDLAHDAILSLDSDGTIRFWNRGAERMYGWTAAEAIGKTSHHLLQTVFPEPLDAIQKALAEKEYWEGELRHTARDGAALIVSSRWALCSNSDSARKGYLEINTDITERRRIEEQLRHTQKLESLGVLAGGVAHDFNNLLTGILGNTSLALEATAPHHLNRMHLEEVMRAAEHAADLTRQLLAYAGKGRFILRTLDLSDLVREISSLIQASIPKNVQVRLQLAEGLPGVEADPGQMQQIVMNLVINGAEAIGPEGGSVLVRTAVEAVDEHYAATVSASGPGRLPTGSYVCLEVHDTGSGMSPETLAKIFDPFFTTKFAGRGLGLSAVLGIVRSHNGGLKVYSRPSQGTTFKVLFPVSANRVDAEPAPAAPDLSGEGTILIVDDEEIVRQTARHALVRYGYETLTAPDGAQAVEIYRDRPHGIAAVLLDLTMPVMSGEETLRRLHGINPQVKVLLTSGYNEVEAVQRFAGKGLAGFIQKPYTAASLAKKIKEVLVG